QQIHAALPHDRGDGPADLLPCRLPLGRSLAQDRQPFPRHAPLGFVWPNLVHCTNWILNGIPVRFPKLYVIWIESGIAFATLLIQRLDDQFLMRPSEAPHLKRLPSEYMRDHCWYTTQPMEATNR